MNAIKFIQQHGVEKAREVVEGAPEGASKFNVKTENYLKTIKVATIGYPSSGMVVQACLKGLNEAYSIDLSDLKRLVESVDLIKYHGGICEAKEFLKCKSPNPKNTDGWDRFEKAIADYESIYGESNE